MAEMSFHRVKQTVKQIVNIVASRGLRLFLLRIDKSTALFVYGLHRFYYAAMISKFVGIGLGAHMNCFSRKFKKSFSETLRLNKMN